MRKSIQQLAKEYEGSVNVNGDVTPITRKKVEMVDSSKWDKLSVTDLHGQRAILAQRLMLAQTHHPEMAKMIQMGLTHIDLLISTKSTDESTLI